jgi:hypothetical protein
VKKVIKKPIARIRISYFIIATLLILSAIVALSFLFSFNSDLVAQGFEGGDVSVIVNGNIVLFPDAKPFIAENRTHVPTRFIAEYLGASAQWDNATTSVTILKNPELMTKRIIKYKVGERKIYINNDEKSLDTDIYIKQNRTYAPVRIIAETLGAIVKWDEGRRAVIINTAISDDVSAGTDANLPVIGATTGDIIGDNYKIIDDRLYVYSNSKKEYIDVSNYSTMYTPKHLSDIARYIHNAVKGTEKYFLCSFNGEEKGNIGFAISANKDQYFGDRINRASISIMLLTNGSSEYVKNTGKYIDIGFTNITDQANYVPKSDINEYLVMVKDLMKIILRESYLESYYHKFEDYAAKKATDLSREDLFVDKVDNMYMRLYNTPHQYKTRLYLTEKELR